MKMMVVGSDGREHALAWRLARSPKVQMVCTTPDNGDMALDKRLQNLPITDPEAPAAFVEREGIHFTVVGPEAPLTAGIVNLSRAKGLRIFGPTKTAVQLESSKSFAKAFMHRCGIPTTKHQIFDDAAQAHAYVDQEGAPIVVKADGLTASKDVVVAITAEETHSATDMMLADNRLGNVGTHVVIEEFLVGEEASFTTVYDGRNAVALATSQDHKRLLDGDAGPSTGGVGAYSPASVVMPTLYTRVLRKIIVPTIHGMEKNGIPYTGSLYAGLMISAEDNPKTLEFNYRMGDPEAQPIMARMKTDLYDVLGRTINGKLDGMELDWDRRTALGVMMTTHNYPDAPRKGDIVAGIPKEAEDSVTFHAGITLKDGVLTINGGRVLCVMGLADTVRATQRAAYNTIEQIHFDDAQHRTNIGHRAIRH